MSAQISLKEAERKTFRTAYNDGLWDILLGCLFLMFGVAPFLSTNLGDFWSSAIFLPFWGLVVLGLWLIRKYVVTPRVGRVKFGPARKAKITKFTIVMLVINVSALVLGILAFIGFGKIPELIYPIFLGITLLIGFSLAAYFLDFSRLYVYGLLVFISPIIGEWLWRQGYASHHGFPLTFGITSGIMILTGLIVFILFLRNNPLPIEGMSSEGV